MERVWEELRKIESQAEHIRAQVQERSKQIVGIAQQEAETLVANSKVYAQEEAQMLEQNVAQEAQREHEVKMKLAQRTDEELKRVAEKRMEKASDRIVSAVLGESACDKNDKVR